jgi:DNA-directed RNA polymerase sigma subunit (sigma70/sigma32)
MAEHHRDRDREIQQELRLSRKFTLADAIGQEAGNFMKGESPVPRMVQVKTEIATLLKEYLRDSSGALQTVLNQWIAADEKRISTHMNAPADAIQEAITSILKSPDTLYELVRQADARWGQMYGERPHFQQPGQTAHPDDEYTHESVRQALDDCLKELTTRYP